MTNSSPQPSHRSVPISWKSARLSFGSAPFLFATAFICIHRKGLRGQLDVHCCVEPSPSDLGTRGVVNLRRKTAGLRHSNNYFIPEASETFPQWLGCWDGVSLRRQYSQLFGLCD